MRDDDIKYWFSLENGVHVPVREGESKREAVSKAISKKRNNTKIQEFKSKKQSNNKIKKMVKKGNTYIPIRENEDEKKTVRDYERTNTESYREAVKKIQDQDRMLQDGVSLTLNREKAKKQIKEAREKEGKAVDYTMDRRVALMKFAMNNKDKIKEWAREYDTNEQVRNKVDKKILNREGLSIKEYFAYLGSTPRSGDIILSGGKNGEDVRVGKDGKLEKITNYRRRKGK